MAAEPIEVSESDNNLEDQISQQPDAILADTLSLLTMKEAGRTSVLSKRWRDLWKLTSHLNFVAPAELHELRCAHTDEFRHNERSKYVTWVNQVIGSHERLCLDEFSIQFDLNGRFSEDIDEWIKFMLRRRAKNMKIDLTTFYKGDLYCLSQECFDCFKNASNVMCLRSLVLAQVNVGGEFVEYLLSNCPNLETLSVSHSEHLVNLKVAGASLPLKYLEISMCESLESIELCAPKLVRFIYYGGQVKFVLGRNPLLAELGVGGGRHSMAVTCSFLLFASYFSQLETLSLKMFFEDRRDLPEVGELKNLKHLKLEIIVMYEQSLVGFTRFILAAPSVVKLTLQVKVHVHMETFCMKEPLSQPHKALKEVEMRGYDGCLSYLEFARYVAKNAINLEKMVIDHSLPRKRRSPEEQEKIAIILRKHAAQLNKSLLSGAKLSIL